MIIRGHLFISYITVVRHLSLYWTLSYSMTRWLVCYEFTVQTVWFVVCKFPAIYGKSNQEDTAEGVFQSAYLCTKQLIFWVGKYLKSGHTERYAEHNLCTRSSPKKKMSVEQWTLHTLKECNTPLEETTGGIKHHYVYMLLLDSSNVVQLDSKLPTLFLLYVR